MNYSREINLFIIVFNNVIATFGVVARATSTEFTDCSSASFYYSGASHTHTEDSTQMNKQR